MVSRIDDGLMPLLIISIVLLVILILLYSTISSFSVLGLIVSRPFVMVGNLLSRTVNGTAVLDSIDCEIFAL